MAEQGRHVLIVEDEQDERLNGARRIVLFEELDQLLARERLAPLRRLLHPVGTGGA